MPAEPSPDNESPRKLRLVSNEARQTVDAFLQAMAEDPLRLTTGFCRLDNAFDRLDEEHVVPAFIEALDDPDAHRRLVAAAVLRGFALHDPASVDDGKAVEKANELLIEALWRGDSDVKAAACYLMAIGGAPPGAETFLKGLMRDPDELVRIMASVARITIAPGNARVLSTLRRGLRHEQQAIVLMSAIGLLYGEPSSPEAVEALTRILLNGAPDAQYAVLTAIKRHGPAAAGFSGALQQLIANPRVRPDVRGYACSVLGWVTRGTDAATDALLAILFADDPYLIRGAIMGFAEVGHVPDDALERLADLIAAEDEDVRIAALNGVRMMGPRARPVLPRLLERVGVDTGVRVADGLADALASIGAVAAPGIVRRLRQGDWREVPTLGVALTRMGAAGAQAVVAALEVEREDHVRGMLVGVLRDMPESANAAVVPALSSLLDRTRDGFAASVIVAAIGSAGTAAVQTVPSLIRCLLSADDELAFRVEQILRSIGPAALPALEEALETASKEEKHRLAGLAVSLWAAGDGDFEVYESLGDDKVWMQFECVADLLTERPMSFKAMEVEIGLRREAGQMNDDFPASERSLLGAIEAVENHLRLPHRMVMRKPGRPSRLTDEARRIAGEVKEYLRRKRLLQRSKSG
ncbi:MAG: HEAT repeat domain-containing protein [Phycisphaerales bacterium]|nr:HEAT repeat domain-containing protein [Phycisphaerales bacterium]